VTTEHALAFVLFAVVAAATPGPSNVILTSVGASVGVRRGVPCLLGVGLGMGAMMFLVAFGFGRLVLGNPLILAGLKVTGASFLLWLAWKIATAGTARAATPGDVVGFWQAAAFQWVNPKSWLICAGAAAAYLQADAGGALAQSLWFAGLFVLAALPSCGVWLVFGATVQRILRTERAARRFNLAMGALLAASIVLFVR
jgi:threonine/homoserine/homoserine lactone efflux protein